MKIKFCGAAISVTGSCHLIITDKYKILLNCGQFQGGKAMEKFEELTSNELKKYVEIMEKDMRQAADDLQFERAAELRDRIFEYKSKRM